MPPSTSIPTGEGSVVGRTVAGGATVQIPDVMADPDYKNTQFTKFGNVRTLLGVPMLREGAATGVIVMMRSEVKPFTEKQIELAQTFADQAVIAIENVRLFEEIQEKSRQVEEASKHKSQFLANMSHELRTPLNAILGYTELILDGIYGDAPDKMRNVLERVQTNGKHLLGLINDVLDLSKIEAGQLVLTLNDYSIKEMMQGVYIAVEPLAGNKKLGFKLEVPPDLPVAHGDERRLSQVLLNLVGNAIKFTDTGAVTMRASAANGSYTIAVNDTGPGISEDDQGQDLRGVQAIGGGADQGQRRHRARPVDRQAHRRDAWRQALGRIRGRQRLDFLFNGAAQGRQPGWGQGMSKRILVVEDQEDNRQILRDLLGSVGYDMSEAWDGEAGVAAAKEQRPDLILMDIQLPLLDGYEATRRIKADPELKNIPIIVVTSYALSGDEGKARAAGCDAYVTKPYSPRQLLAKIKEFLP